MTRKTWFRFMVTALCVHYLADAGADLADGGGSLYGWFHLVVACVVGPVVIGQAWRYSREEVAGWKAVSQCVICTQDHRGSP